MCMCRTTGAESGMILLSYNRIINTEEVLIEFIWEY